MTRRAGHYGDEETPSERKALRSLTAPGWQATRQRLGFPKPTSSDFAERMAALGHAEALNLENRMTTGTCDWCGKTRRITTDGLLERHRISIPVTRTAVPSVGRGCVRPWCSGSGKPPRGGTYDVQPYLP